jgi:molybdopterin synthase catalytic subunit
MSVTVRCYAAAAEQLGPKVQLDVGTPSTAGQVRAALVAAHPDAAELIGQCRLAVDLDIAGTDTPVHDDSEIALLPPFAGGSRGEADDEAAPVVVVDVREPPLGAEEALTAIAHPAAGAQVVFLGRVRDHSPSDASVHRLDYSAYEPMARQVLATIAHETCERWPSLHGIALIHAVGELAVGAHSVLVACSSPHRAEAYQANAHALEELKARVPVWKREVGSRGSRWVNLQAPTG